MSKRKLKQSEIEKEVNNILATETMKMMTDFIVMIHQMERQ